MVTAKESSFKAVLFFTLITFFAAAWLFVPPFFAGAEAAQLKRHTLNDGLVSDTITAMASDKKGVLWAGSIDGAARFDGEKWEKFTVENGCLKDNAVWAVGVDEGDSYSRNGSAPASGSPCLKTATGHIMWGRTKTRRLKKRSKATALSLPTSSIK